MFVVQKKWEECVSLIIYLTSLLCGGGDGEADGGGDGDDGGDEGGGGYARQPDGSDFTTAELKSVLPSAEDTRRIQ